VIKGITHDLEGRPKVRRSVTTKLAIGLPPEGSRNYPTKLDHIAFLKKVYEGKEIKWVTDEDLTKHYKEQTGNDLVRSLWITFLDDDIETVFPTKWGAYVTRGLFCRGDGETAERRPNFEKQWNPFEPFKGKCANGGCPLAENGACKPNGTLYFFLQDFPKLGSLCKLQTTGWQSIQQIYSALQDLRAVTGGRLLGVSARLFIHPDKTVFESNGKTQTGMKWCWGLELAAADLAGMGTKLLEAAHTFRTIKGELTGRVLEVEEDDAEVAQEMTSEFYPPTSSAPAPTPATTATVIDALAQKAKDDIDGLLTEIGMNQANRLAIYGSVSPENLAELLKSLRQIVFIFRTTSKPMEAANSIIKNTRRLAAYAEELTKWYEAKKANGNQSPQESAASAAQRQSADKAETDVARSSRPSAGPSLFIDDNDTKPTQPAQSKPASKRFAF
jgi:predicted hydrocarbon binding protein